MKKLLMVVALLWMPILGYGHESYTHEDDSFTYHYRVENGEACVTRITIDNCDHVGGPDRIYKRMVRYNNNGSILAEYPVTIIGDGNGVWNVFIDSLYHGCGVALQEGIREIRAGAFRNMNHYLMADDLDDGWEYVYLPTTLKTVGLNAFEGDTQIKHLRIDDLAAWCDIDFANAAANPLTYAKSLRLINRNLIINASYSYDVIKDLVIPKGVNEVKQYVFYNCEPLASVEFPWSCKAIGGFAFHGCTNISELVLHDNFTSIGTNAFQGCTKLQSASLGSGLTSVPSSMFKDCASLSSVVLGENVTKIESCAFEGCSSLKEMYGSSKLTTIEERAFAHSGVTNIPNGVTSIGAHAFEGCLALGLVLPNSVKTIGDSAFAESSQLQYLVIPAGIESVGFGITLNCSKLLNIIGPRRLKSYFQICNPTAYYTYNDALISLDANGGEVDKESVSVDLYSAVGELPVPFRPGYAFLGWYMDGGEFVTSETVVSHDITLYAHWEEYVYNYIDNGDGTVTLSGSFDETGSLLGGCVSPEPVGCYAIPDEIDGKCVVGIAERAFASCSFTSVTIPESVKSIGESAFSWCVGLEHIEIPDSVTSIGDYAFECCFDLTSVAIGNVVTNIGEGAFYCCSGLSSLSLGAGVAHIGEYAFLGCLNLTEFVVAEGNPSYKSDAGLLLTKDGNMLLAAFAAEGNVKIPGSVTHISDSVFFANDRVTRIEIPDSVTSIGDCALAGCPNLTEFVVAEGNPSYKSVSGLLLTKEGKMLLAAAGVGGDVKIPNGVTSIANCAFYNCFAMTSVDIPNSVTSIGDNAFLSCYNMMSVSIGNSVTNIGSNAFSNCDSLTCVEIPASVMSIGEGAFSFCRDITKFIVAADNSAYKSVSGMLLTKDGSTLVTAGAAKGDVTIPDGVITVDSNAFAGCSDLTGVTIPDGVTSIGMYAFAACESLTSVTIPDTVVSIDSEVFAFCWSLTVIYAPSSLMYQMENALGMNGPPDVEIVWGYMIPQINDNFVDAVLISGETGRVTGSNIGAGVEDGEPLLFDDELGPMFASTSTVWWKWTAPKAGSVVFNTEGSNFYTVLGIYVINSMDELLQIAANGEEGDVGTSSVVFEAVANMTYYIVVGGRYTSIGNIVLSWSQESVQLPVIAIDVSPDVVEAAVDGVGFADAAVKDVIGESAEEYNAFKAWAGSVKSAGSASGAVAGEAAVVANAHAAAAYLLGAERLFENEPTVEFGEVEIRDGNDGGALGITRPTMTVAVTVKDGEEAVKCAAEKVKSMFEATSDLGDWNGASKLTPTVTTSGIDASGKMTFEVTPGDGTANRAFLRIKR